LNWEISYHHLAARNLSVFPRLFKNEAGISTLTAGASDSIFCRKMALTQTVLGWFRREEREHRTARSLLTDNYRGLAHLARQIKLHADQAPYSFVGERLRQMASEKEKSLTALGESIERLGGRATSIDPMVPSGRNHWQRLSHDLEAQKQLEAEMTDDASHLALDGPEYSDLLRQLVVVEKRHKQILNDLLIKADPQADQT
jgi:hypothetical protein